MTAATRLTTKDVVGAFGVTPMTVYNWRMGSPTREPLPAETVGRSVFYRASRVRAWARRHGVPLLGDLKPAGAAPRKPGPKAQKPKAG